MTNETLCLLGITLSRLTSDGDYGYDPEYLMNDVGLTPDAIAVVEDAMTKAAELNLDGYTLNEILQAMIAEEHK